MVWVSSRKSVDTAPARCLESHGFDSRLGFIFFFVPRARNVEYFIFHISLPSLKLFLQSLFIYHERCNCAKGFPIKSFEIILFDDI